MEFFSRKPISKLANGDVLHHEVVSECVGLEWPLFRSNSEDFLGSNQGKSNKRGGGFHFHK